MTDKTLSNHSKNSPLVTVMGFGIQYSHVLALVVLLIASAIASPFFFSTQNIMNVLRGASPLMIVAIGMTIVIICRGIDLSVGSILGLSTMVAAMLMPYGGLVAIIGALLVGTVLGLLNGLMITKLGLQPFIATLAMLISARGLTYILSDGSNVVMSGSPDWFRAIGSGFVGVVPIPVIIAGLVWAVCIYLMYGTQLGRHIYAVGANEEASRLYGISCDAVTIKTYAISGFLAALAGIIMLARLNVAEPNSGQLMELHAISAALIGGTTFDGGVGGVLGTIIGVLILSILANILNLLGVSPFVQMLVQGLIIVIAVVMSDARNRLRSRK